MQSLLMGELMPLLIKYRFRYNINDSNNGYAGIIWKGN